MRRAFSVLFAGGLLGKVVGFARELVLAALFGAGQVVDAYRAALTATLVPLNFFASDTLSAGFIPIFTRYRKADAARADALFWSLAMVLLSLAVLVAIALYAFAPTWTGMLVPGFDIRSKQLTIEMIRVMAIGIPLYIASSLLIYLEIGHQRYALASLRSTIQSLGLIGGAVAAFALSSPVYLAWGFTGAYAAIALVGFSLSVRRGYIPSAKRPELALSRDVLAEFWRISRPLLLLPLFLQGNIIVERVVASLLGGGVLASLEYARTLTETGLALVAVPLGLAGLSELGRLTEAEMRRSLVRVIRVLFLVFIPLCAFLAMHAQLVVELLFARGAFQDEASRLTSNILAGLAVGLWLHVAGYVLIKALNARQRNLRAVWIMATALVVNAVANLSLYPLIGPLALGLSASLNAGIVCVLALNALGLLRMVIVDTAPVVLGLAVYVPVALWIDTTMAGMGAASLAVATAVLYAAVVAVISPAHRSVLIDVVRRRKDSEDS